ncbi:MAG: type II toxin-antitoxin system VapC family toxin [Candidatus Hydrothermarchaeales archaeon]
MRAFIDSNIFIYAAQAHPEFGEDCKRIIASIEKGEMAAVTSTLNISEVGEVLHRYAGRKASSKVLEFLLALPMEIEPVVKEHLIAAGEYFREYSINYFDCIYLALMREKFIDSIITNDKHFEKVEGINVVTPTDASR